MNTVDLYPGSSVGGERKENIFPANIPQSIDDGSQEEGQGGEILEVTVSDPEKKGDGVYAYVSYKVNTKVQTGPGKFTQSSVVRRYSDFAWLHEQLLTKNPGYLVPPLPEKAIIGRFSPMFVDSRRRSLELFLNRIAQHKALAKSECVKLFLHGGQNFLDAREGKLAVATKKTGKGFFDYVTDITSTVTTAVAGPKEREKTKDDITCDNIVAYADNLEASVTAVHKHITVLTKKTKEIANAWFDFGFSCTLLGQYETEQEEPQLGNAFAKLGNCADRLSVLLTQTVDSQIVHFQEPVGDFLRILGAVKDMMKTRNNALLQYQNSLGNLEFKQAALLKYQSKPGKEDRAAAAEGEVVEAQRKVDEDNHQLQIVTDRVFAEIARFRQEKKLNFKNAILDFVRMQIEHCRKTQHAWESIVPDIESLPFN